MKNAVGLIELLVVTIIAILLFFVFKNNSLELIPTKESVQKTNIQKQKIDEQIKELEQLKLEHDNNLKSFGE